MSQIEVRLFGGLELSDSDGDGNPFALNGRKVRALLGLLLVESGRWHSRDRLAALLWGGRSDSQARHSLNQAFHKIRQWEKAADVALIEREADRIRIAKDALNSDLQQFELRMSEDPIGVTALRVGNLLEGYETVTPEFSDWLNTKRTLVERKWQSALGTLVSSELLKDSNSETGISAARLLLDLDPLDENARRSVMLLLAKSGQRTEALRQYEICREILRTELGVEPDPTTQTLFKEIRFTNATLTVEMPAGPDESQDLLDTPMLEERPIVAVMPFANLDDDPDFSFMVDGLTQDIILALSAFRSLRILAHVATFRLRDADLDHTTIRRRLGATHAVSGRVRRAGNKLRISAELLDCRTGELIWAGLFDRAMTEMFALEEMVSRHIAAAIEPSLEAAEVQRVLGRPPETLEAYELLLRGYWHLYRRTPDDIAEARRCLEVAVSRDPAYATPYAVLAFLKYVEATTSFGDSNYLDLMYDSFSTAEQAIELDPLNPRALTYSAIANTRLGNLKAAFETINRSIDLCPSFYQSHSALAFICDFMGKFSDAKYAADETIRLRPHDPMLYRCIISKSIAEYQTSDYDRARNITRDSLRSDASWWNSRMLLAASLSKDGQIDEARDVVDRMRDDFPDLTLEIMLRRMPFADPLHAEHLSEGMVLAGWRD
jgi:TolB-like protein/DNA-binding SARP family transcriptional activator